MVITWVAPNDGGSPITGYRVKIRESQGTLTEDSTNCGMTQSTSLTCSIPLATLQAAPYLLTWGDSVFASVIAINTYGDSLESDQGNGGLITTSPDPPTALVEVYAERTRSSLGLAWTAPTFTGGDVILDYRVNYREKAGTWAILAQNVGQTSYTATNLAPGTTYEFNVEARNSYGYSTTSTGLELLCAFVPFAPLTVTTSNVGDQVEITWLEPVTNGSPITGYRVYVVDSVGEFLEETTVCVGTPVLESRSCQVALTTLRDAPFSLSPGTSVQAKVRSINFYGESAELSDPGAGAFIQTVPDAPISVQDDPEVTSDEQVKIVWTDGGNNGGTPVLDYSVYFDQGANDWVLLSNNVLAREFTKTGLNAGTTYAFKVASRNSVGLGPESASVSILAARVPDKPINLANNPAQTTAYQIGVTWQEATYNGGSDVIDFELSFRTENELEFTVFASDYVLAQATITNLTPAITYDLRVRSRNVKGYSDYSDLASVLAA